MAEAAGHEVVAEAESLAAALAAVAAHAPAAVVLDGRLEPAVGDAVARLRAAAPASRIVVIAALDETGVVRAAVAAGAGKALLRPFTPARVAEALGGS
jgi:DNA-binding NarL/FixJ family response regulator